MRRRGLVCFCLSLFSVAVVPAVSQSNYAVLHGSVSDAQHRAIVGASVQLKSTSTEFVRRVDTNEVGLFEIPGLLPDDYELKITAPGMALLTQKLQLEVGQKLTLDLILQLQSVAQTIDVADLPETIRTRDASVGEVIEPQSIRELPLNGRMLIDLVLTLPGAHVSHGAQTGDMNPLYWRPGQRSAITIGGINCSKVSATEP